MNNLVLTILVVCLLFNLVVTWSLIHDDGLSAKQKIYQTLLTWIVPIIGGSVVLAMQGQNHSRQELKSILPFPFYLVGHVDHASNPFKTGGSDGAEYSEGSCGEGTCGSD